MKAYGSDQAERVVEFEHVAEIMAAKYYAPGFERDDILQEARIGILKGLRDWRPSCGCKLDTFVSLAAERHLVTTLIAALRRKHSVLNDALSMDAAVSPSGETELDWHERIEQPCADVVDLVDARERLRCAGRIAQTRLTLLERECLSGVLNGLSYGEIARAAGVDEKAVDNALYRLRLKFSKDPTMAAA